MVRLCLGGGCLTDASGQPGTIPTEAERLYALGDFAGVEMLCRRTVAESPGDAAAHYNLGVALVKLDRLEEALFCFRKTIELHPAFAVAYTNLGVCLNAFNLIKQAREGFAIAHSLTPENPIPIVNEGIAALTLGDYADGWKKFAARWQIPAYAKFKRSFDKPVWNGEPLSGKTLFLYAEQGFGDTLQMARYVPLLAAQGAKIIIESPPALARLLHSLRDSATIIVKGDPLPAFDFYAALMDVPSILGTTIETIPSATPYLFADTNETAFYQNLLPRPKARRIGLSWAGRSSHENDHNRSLAFAQLQPLLADQDTEWISLQRLVPACDQADLLRSPVLKWGENFPDFAAAAAAIMTLDLVITVDTAIAHLAGSLGKEVWILLPFYADWRWLMQREDSPWYPQARLFRQKKRKDWAEVITRVAGELKIPPRT